MTVPVLELEIPPKGQIGKFVARIQDPLRLPEPFPLEIDDTTGNSFVVNPNAPTPDLDPLQRAQVRRSRPQQDPGGGEEKEDILGEEKLKEEVGDELPHQLS